MDALRVKKLDEKYEQIKMTKPQKLDFSKMTNEELNRHIKLMLENNHKKSGIRNYELAITQLKFELERELIDEQEFKLMMDAEKNYWKDTKEIS